MERKTKLSGMGRRRVLQTLAGMGVSIPTLAHLTETSLAEIPEEVEEGEVLRFGGYIPKDPSQEESSHDGPPQRQPEFYTISKEKWTSVESTKDARNQINNRISEVVPELVDKHSLDQNDLEVSAVFKSPGKHQDNFIEAQISKNSLPDGADPELIKENLIEYIPSSIDGIAGREIRDLNDIRHTEKIPQSVLDSYRQRENIQERVEDIRVKVALIEEELINYYDDEYRPVGPGCQFTDETGSACTLASSVYDTDDEYTRALTAAHCLEEDDETELHQPSTDNKIGERDLDKWIYDGLGDNLDVCVIEPGPSVDFFYSFVADGGGYEDWGTSGIQSHESIEDMCDDNEIMEKRGRSTGETEGPVVSVGENTFVVDLEAEGGDSGGPAYTPMSHGARMAGVNKLLEGDGMRASIIEVTADELNFSI